MRGKYIRQWIKNIIYNNYSNQKKLHHTKTYLQLHLTKISSNYSPLFQTKSTFLVLHQYFFGCSSNSSSVFEKSLNKNLQNILLKIHVLFWLDFLDFHLDNLWYRFSSDYPQMNSLNNLYTCNFHMKHYTRINKITNFL